MAQPALKTGPDNEQSVTPEFGSEKIDKVVGKICALVEGKIRGALRKMKYDEEKKVVVDETVFDKLAQKSTTGLTLSSTSEEDEVTSSATDERTLEAEVVVNSVRVSEVDTKDAKAAVFADYMNGVRYQIGDMLRDVDLEDADNLYLTITIRDGNTVSEDNPNRIEIGRKLSFFKDKEEETAPKKKRK